ncbi:MAG TPA: BamA/TamA family outer membrane protein [Puia sp.]|nr:BamA/TamA family outer membrane protein [Puia sp.]
MVKYFLLLVFLSPTAFLLAQSVPDTTINPGIKQIDLIDIAQRIFNKNSVNREDVIVNKKGRVHFSAFPAVGYTLQTGFAGVLSANAAFFTSAHNHESANISTVITSIAYTSKSQIIFPIASSIWTKNNEYNILTDWRYLKYPSETFGLGGHTKQDSFYNVDYSYIKLHQAILKKIVNDLYAGLGYDFDYFWNISEVNPPTDHETDFQQYGLSHTEKASGLSFILKYDSRRNPINPQKGIYANILFQPKFTFMGSDANWQSLLLEFRSYIPFPDNSRNILAFWSYNWFTLGGNPPYLLLPSTGWDEFSNTGRGYIQGRFRSLNMVDQEAEYRFSISRNGLFGGVVFANAESFSDVLTGKYEVISPGAGLGIRIMLNKFSRTNIALDYAWGSQGSSGFFVNLGEVF